MRKAVHCVELPSPTPLFEHFWRLAPLEIFPDLAVLLEVVLTPPPGLNPILKRVKAVPVDVSHRLRMKFLFSSTA